MLNYIKDLWKQMTFIENVKLINNGQLSIVYLGKDEYIGQIHDIKMDTIFSISEKSSYENVKKQMDLIPWDYPLNVLNVKEI